MRILVANRVHDGFGARKDAAAALAKRAALPSPLWIGGWLVFNGWPLLSS